MRFSTRRLDRIHYAALTQGDTELLEQHSGRASCLFNSLALPSERIPDPSTSLARIRKAFDLPPTAHWSIYPVRGIRRKNIGEWLLLTRLMPEGHFSGVTLEPTTPVERESYRRWRELATECVPNARFNVGHHEDVRFLDNLSAASKVISTSVAEGFGMTFLEPWLAGREVIARRLPRITRDFENTGVDLSHFYDSIQIPGTSQWIGDQQSQANRAFAKSQASLPSAFRLPSLSMDESFHSLDFACLPPSEQVAVLRRVDQDGGFRNAIVQQNPEVIRQLSSPPLQRRIERNAAIIGDHYSVESVGKRLIRRYEKILEGTVPCKPSGDPPESFVAMVNHCPAVFPLPYRRILFPGIRVLFTPVPPNANLIDAQPIPFMDGRNHPSSGAACPHSKQR